MFREDYERSKKKCKVVLWNFLLWHNEHATRAKVWWEDVCMRALKFGGLNITFPKEAMEILLCKWVLYVLEPKESNLNILFKYTLEWSMPFLVYFIMNVGIWWAIRFIGGSFRVSILKIYELHKNGLKNIKKYRTTIEK